MTGETNSCFIFLTSGLPLISHCRGTLKRAFSADTVCIAEGEWEEPFVKSGRIYAMLGFGNQK